MTMHENFEKRIDTRWHINEVGTGTVNRQPGDLHLTVHPTHDDSTYSNAQLSDYDPSLRDFQHEPPLRIQIQASTSTPADTMVGTAGFGLWNHAFSPDTQGLALPQALWFFFGAPPNHMLLAKGQPPHGWKAATFNARRWQFLSLLPTAALAMPLMNVPFLYDRLWHIGQNAIGVREAALDASLLNNLHTYTLEWLPDKAMFYVDGALVLHASHAIPSTPLGFIVWIDNQYAIVSPKGRFGWGVSPVTEAQSLIVHSIHIDSL